MPGSSKINPWNRYCACSTFAAQLGKISTCMGSTVSKIADEIRLHGSWEAYQAFNEEQARKWSTAQFHTANGLDKVTITESPRSSKNLKGTRQF